MMNEQVRRIMTTNPKVVNPSHSIDELTNLMETERLNQLPVVEEGKLVGWITTYDLWRWQKENKDQVLTGKTVSDLMTRNVIKITPLDKVGTAAELFMDKRFKSLPVVNLENELKGVVTSFDVLRHVLTEEYPRPILYQEVFE